MNTNSRISLVIPVYNEVEQIADCLRAVMAQTVKPYEVIVVDNNSSDQTALIASLFPGVRVIRERRQGVVFARSRGFDAAHGDIIARIDADTLIDTDWVATLQTLFADDQLDLVTGSVALRGICAAKLASRIDLFWRRYLDRRLGTLVGLQGANMALRRRVWQAIRCDVCLHGGLHEDFDIGLHANAHGFTARFAEELQAAVCHRQLDAGFRNFFHYAMTSPRTYTMHGARREARIMLRVVAFVTLLYPVIYLLTRGYDAELERFSLTKLFVAALPPRVNPATFVD